MAWIPAIMKLLPMLGQMKGGMGAMGGGGGGGGAAAMGGGFGAGASSFATPGTPGSVNGTPMPQTPGGYSNMQPGGYAQGNSIGGPPAQAQQSGSEKQMGLLQVHDNLQKNMNGVAEGLKMFGHSLGGLDKTPLNNIPRNTPPVIRPVDLQNPGTVGLAALMQMIAGGR